MTGQAPARRAPYLPAPGPLRSLPPSACPKPSVPRRVVSRRSVVGSGWRPEVFLPPTESVGDTLPSVGDTLTLNMVQRNSIDLGHAQGPQPSFSTFEAGGRRGAAAGVLDVTVRKLHLEVEKG